MYQNDIEQLKFIKKDHHVDTKKLFEKSMSKHRTIEFMIRKVQEYFSIKDNKNDWTKEEQKE